MGFGLAFIGYLTLLFFKVMPPAMMVGMYVLYRGLTKLAVYDKNFEKAKTMSLVLMVYHGVYTVLWALRMTDLISFFDSKVFALADDTLYYGLLLILHIFLYKALEGISRQCGFTKGIKKAYMSRVLLCMYYALTAIHIPLTFFVGQNTYLAFGCLICQLAWILYTAVYLYSAYMHIATDEILAEEEKKIAEFDAKFKQKKEEHKQIRENRNKED